MSMNSLARAATFAGLAFLMAGAAWGAELEIAPDRMAVVDGKRTFILGLYENPEDDSVLRAVGEAGFNLVYGARNQASLDRLHEHGLWAWLNTGYAIDLSVQTEAREAQLRQMVADFAEHPALLVWEVPDEALWNNWHEAYLWRASQEPEQLEAHLETIEDEALQTEARKTMDEARRLRHTGFYAESEQMMDGVWTLLGLESPRPGFGYADAPERAARMQRGMLRGYELLAELDPAHPIWMNHAPRNQIAQLAAFNEAADIVGCDIYPVPGKPFMSHSDVADQTVSAVGVYTQRMQEAAPGKPVWMVLQGFSWAKLFSDVPEEQLRHRRYPTKEETRFMAYNAIVHGARGILYWGTAYIDREEPFWEELLDVVRELSELQPVLSAPDAELPLEISFAETFGSMAAPLRVLPKQAPSGVWFLIANENFDPMTYTLSGLADLDGALYDLRGEGRQVVVRDGQLTETIAAKAIHVIAPR